MKQIKLEVQDRMRNIYAAEQEEKKIRINQARHRLQSSWTGASGRPRERPGKCNSFLMKYGMFKRFDVKLAISLKTASQCFFFFFLSHISETVRNQKKKQKADFVGKQRLQTKQTT